jgi:hypothetical protein
MTHETANEMFVGMMREFGLEVDPALLPGRNTPMPETNACVHILDHENGYGTPEREFVAICGRSWKSVGSTGEHKYFFPAETYWHKHVNCEACRMAFEAAEA